MKIELRELSDIKPYENNPGLNGEVWMPVPGYEELYEVSSHGRLRRANRSRLAPAGYVLKPRLTWDGYLRYSLFRQGKYQHIKAHRLVALAFLGPAPFAGAHVGHSDGDRCNNLVSNLRWVTQAENEADKKRHGSSRGAPAGERHHHARLTAALVQQMRQEAANGDNYRRIARRHAVALLTTYDAITGKTWSLITDPAPIPVRRRYKHAR